MAEEVDIKEDLIDQLERNGIFNSYYLDMIDDYMSLWEIKNKLIKDIKARGVSIKWSNGGGQEGFKKNDSISELNKTNAQMLRVLNELGLKSVRAVEPVSKDDEEM